jgi:hypothetical protein
LFNIFEEKESKLKRFAEAFNFKFPKDLKDKLLGRVDKLAK